MGVWASAWVRADSALARGENAGATAERRRGGCLQPHGRRLHALHVAFPVSCPSTAFVVELTIEGSMRDCRCELIFFSRYLLHSGVKLVIL